jgi:hypothetical protein
MCIGGFWKPYIEQAVGVKDVTGGELSNWKRARGCGKGVIKDVLMGMWK